jgi:hypothetical protein
VSQRRTVQLAAAAVAHHIRGDYAVAERTVQDISPDPPIIVAAFTRLCLVTGQALALIASEPLSDVLDGAPFADHGPIPDTPVQRSTAIAYILALAGDTPGSAADTGKAFGDVGVALNSLFDLAIAIVRSMARNADPAEVAARIATLVAFTSHPSSTHSDTAQWEE